MTVLNHVGGQPIGFYVGRSPSQLGVYEDLVKYVKLAHAYFEEFALPEMTPREKNEYETVMKKVLPFLGRFDKATSKMLLPSLDGQGGWILDGKLKIKVPDIPKSMPVPELAVIAGLNDPELFIKAMTEYRESFNGIVDVLTKLAPPGRTFRISRFGCPGGNRNEKSRQENKNHAFLHVAVAHASGPRSDHHAHRGPDARKSRRVRRFP